MPKSVEIATQTPGDVKKLLSHNDAKPRTILMLYKMNMCPHCIALEPTWKEVEAKLARDPSILVTKVEYSNMNLLPRGMTDVRGFPSIVVIKHGKVAEEYNGDRSCDSIVQFAKSHRPPKPAPEKPKRAKKST